MKVLTKICSTCGGEKPLEEFSKNGARLYSKCKICCKERDKKYRETHKESIKEYYESLSDSLIRNILKTQGWPKESITPEIIETKRLIIKITREIKNQTL